MIVVWFTQKKVCFGNGQKQELQYKKQLLSVYKKKSGLIILKRGVDFDQTASKFNQSFTDDLMLMVPFIWFATPYQLKSY